MIDRIKKFTDEIKETYKRYCIKNNKRKHRKKSSTLTKDVVLGTQEILPAKHITEGVKVIGPHGMGHIKKIQYPWITVVYSSGRTGDHKLSKLYQVFFSVWDVLNDNIRVLPLSYADYKYIDLDEVHNVDIEGHITNKGYYQLTDQEKADREYLTVTNESKHSQDVLRKLKKKGYKLVKSN